jgi:hypothetical protein
MSQHALKFHLPIIRTRTETIAGLFILNRKKTLVRVTLDFRFIAARDFYHEDSNVVQFKNVCDIVPIQS